MKDNRINPSLQMKKSIQDAGVKPAARRIAYKTVLAAVVIGILIISVLWMFVISREETQVNATLATDPDMKVHETSISNGLQVAGIEDQIGKIDRSFTASISDRIGQGFEVQQNHSAVVQNQLSDMTKDIQAIKVTIADQTETNQNWTGKSMRPFRGWRLHKKSSGRQKAVKRKTIGKTKTVPLRPRHSKSMPSMSGTMIPMWLPPRLGALRF